MDRRQQNYMLKDSIKRIGITILCCLPLLIVLGYFLQGLNRFLTIIIFVLFMILAICIEEYIYSKRQMKKETLNKLLHKDEDVFK